MQGGTSSLVSELCPIISTLSTSDLSPILARSNFNSLSHLLSAFQDSVDKVTVRTSTYEARVWPKFAVNFVERALPPRFTEAAAGGTTMTRSRSGTGTASGLPHMPSANEPAPSAAPAPLNAAPPTPTTPFSAPNQGERDELFLDSLSSLISQRVGTWLAGEGRPELSVRGAKLKRKPLGEDEAPPPMPQVDEGWQGRGLEQLTPWYCALRDEVLKRREMVEWETFAWPVGCLLALSTSNPNPLNALAALWDLTAKDNLFAPASFSPRSGANEDGRQEWANPDVLRYIVLVHDFGAGGGRDAWEDAQRLHDTIRKTYGLHTALLPIFSASPTASSPQARAPNVSALWKTPSRLFDTARRESIEVGLGIDGGNRADPEAGEAEVLECGGELSEDDLRAVKIFMREMVVQSLLPWLERSVIVGNEQFTAAKKSIGGRLWGAGRKYFGGNARSSSPVSATGAPIGYNAVKGFYPHAAQESQSRRLADLAFMIGDYSLAASVYEQASKDYKTDRAWRYFAGASRMAGLSQLLQHPVNTPLNFNPDGWLEQALQTPLGVGAPSIDLDGLKAMLMYYEVYQLIGDWRAAPVGLVRTAGEHDEIASAVLLEQAALSDLHLPMSSKRKYAFHMAMAATRYEKSGVKSLSRRCLSQAASLYRIGAPTPDDIRCPLPAQSWNGIRSYLHHGLGRQAYNVGRAGDAVEHFLELLVGADVQGDEARGEESWLDDFGLAWEHLGQEATKVVAERDLKIRVTVFDARDVRVRIHQNSNGVASEDDALAWTELENSFLETGFKDVARKPTSLARSDKENEAIINETFYLELRARNPLDAPVAIGGLRVDTDAQQGTVEIEPPQEIELGPREALRIYVPVRAKALTSFSFTQLHYRFNDLLPCTETLVRKPKRVQSTRPNQATPKSIKGGLAVTVCSPIPILSVALEDSPDSLLAGESTTSTITITNTGQIALTDLKGLSSHPSFAAFSADSSPSLYTASTNTSHSGSIEIPNQLSLNTPFTIALPDFFSENLFVLEPGNSLTIPILWRGDTQGVHVVRWLFAFRGADSATFLTARASTTLEVPPSFQFRPFIRPSHSGSAPYVLGLEAKNAFVPDDLVIDQISSVSPYWQCSHLDKEKEATQLGTVGWQQSTHILVGVEPSETAPSAGSTTAFVVDQLDSLLQGKDVTKRVPGPVRLRHASLPVGHDYVDPCAPALLRTILQTHLRLRRASLTAQLPTIPSRLQPHIFTMFGERSLDLVVFWHVSSTGQRGHHHLTDLPFGAGRNALQEVLDVAELKAGGLYAESQRERSVLLAGLRRSEFGVDENPMAMTLRCEDSVSHDFSSGPCTASVSFVIRNLSPTEPLAFRLLFQSSATAGTTSSTMAYAGNLTHTGRIAPLDSAKVVAPLWVPREGVFNVGDWLLEGFAGQKSWYRSGTRKDLRVRAV